MTTDHEPTGDDPVEQLRRWEAFGAVWEVVHRDRRTATVSLRRCDGGEEVGRFTSDDPALLAFLDRADGADGSAADGADDGTADEGGTPGAD